MPRMHDALADVPFVHDVVGPSSRAAMAAFLVPSLRFFFSDHGRETPPHHATLISLRDPCGDWGEGRSDCICIFFSFLRGNHMDEMR